ncbi:DUF262 domain-containing protein [Clostridium botulinum]|nr:DUF262 domain-containing protein [Clostridium botulinum]MCS4461736.1 DUF262 domain-containing protein [Clostridium botulinum]
MDFYAYPRTIKDILTLNRKYSIPRFQREYAWEEEEHTMFWKDIHINISLQDGKLSNNDYFIGVLVLVGNDSKDSEFLVVDGQQRLTTITIIFSALTHIFNYIKEDGLAQSCYSYVEGKDGDYKPFFKLENENPKPFLQQRIQNMNINSNYQPETEEEEKLLHAYKFYKNKLKKENIKKIFGTTVEYKDILKAIRDQILSFKTIFITVDSIEEAYTIFETLNAKGKNLESIDLIKNKLFKILKNEHPTDEAKEKWKKIKNTLFEREYNESISKFFRHFWLSKYEFTTQAKIYDSFLKKVPQNSTEYLKFINDLEQEVKNYLLIISPSQNDWKQQEEKEVFNSLLSLNIFKVEQARTIILALMYLRKQKLLNVNEVRDVLKLIEKFHFIFTAVCSSRASGLEGKYSTLARKFRVAENRNNVKKVLNDLKEYYQSKKPEYEIFESKFKEIQFTNDKTTQKNLYNIYLLKLKNIIVLQMN